ncbi:MAG: TIGR01777 family oxidoreductase [Desulfobacterales bacterium]|nr:MAG: TIGR01777 family oxidoreductase [Desulfobacterales bacterium]
MKILITGGSGFVGSNLADYLLDRGHRIIATGRSAGQNRIRHESYRYISADTTQPGKWQTELEDVDAVVNLAGTTIFKRWTAGYKKQIYDSRILTTRNIVAALPTGANITLCSASGAGFYGDRGDDILKEDEKPGNDFLAGVSVDWEKEAMQAADKGIRAVVMRFGVIIGKDGGAMAKMIPAFKLFVGGSMGSGKQWFPWMHLDDLMAAILFILESDQIEGAVNFCAPNQIQYRDLARTLGEVLKRPSVMPAPAFMIRLVMGEFGNVFLASQRTVPDKLLSHGFSFRYAQIKDAIRAVVGEGSN